IERLFAVKGTKSVDTFQKALGKIMWEKVGMGRNKEGLQQAIPMLTNLKNEFWQDVRITGDRTSLNPELEKALRFSDHVELALLMAKDALQREESCGGHFREEHQTEEGEAKRDDNNFMFVAAWEYKGEDAEPEMHREDLNYEFIKVQQRNYK
ncbi:MAG: fumarate reductase/succinate dehydrogenase flavoprotein subunit, partial [Bacteroidales bacterium]|nr:fumarate reductase/succinate dehydrogenase flavoprotein subunit [Bacteroidales bacterium]MDR1847961.1 fumarate reductase/succinate dehydrogenase flavoprotein subunit [Bacteroidales bacterium]